MELLIYATILLGLTISSPFVESQLKGVKTQIFSRQGFYLSIDPENGSVKGVPEESDDTVFYLIPVGLRVVSIQHRDTLLYIAMNSEGRVYTSVSSNKQKLTLKLC